MSFNGDAMKELSVAEAKYVDEMAGTIISGLFAKGNSFNTDYVRNLSQTAYQLALVMLEVRNEKIKIKEEFSNALTTVVPSSVVFGDDISTLVAKKPTKVTAKVEKKEIKAVEKVAKVEKKEIKAVEKVAKEIKKEAKAKKPKAKKKTKGAKPLGSPKAKHATL